MNDNLPPLPESSGLIEVAPFSQELAYTSEQMREYGQLCRQQAAPRQGDSYDDLWNAVSRIETASVCLPTLQIKHEGGLSADVQNIVDAIVEAAALLEASAQREQHPDDAAVDRFAAAMKEKLADAREKGRDGWESCPVEWLQCGLVRHVIKGDPRDVANFCMMLWNRGDRTKIEDQWVYDLFGVWPVGTAQREQQAANPDLFQEMGLGQSPSFPEVKK